MCGCGSSAKTNARGQGLVFMKVRIPRPRRSLTSLASEYGKGVRALTLCGRAWRARGRADGQGMKQSTGARKGN
eukprot:1159566-Pelagomonas_calceolata.AAC.25